MTHWSGTQSGWNTRGGTLRDQLRQETENIEKANPDSPYWQRAAEVAQDALVDRIGKDDYLLWAEMAWPGIEIQRKTWKQIYLSIMNFHHQELECSCNGVTESCRVCQAYSRLNNTEIKGV